MKKRIRTRMVVFLLLFGGFTLNVMGINPNEGGGSKAQLELKNIISQLEKKFDVSITMDAELLQDEAIAKSISDNSDLILAKESISKALDKMVKGTKLEYKKISKDFFVITEKPFSKTIGRKSIAPVEEKGKTVKGKVFGKVDRLPIPGVTVMIKGTSIGTATDLDGNFSLEVPENTVELLFSFVGMKTKTVKISDLQGDKNVVYMEEDSFGLEEIVVSGVAAETPQKNLSITVKRINSKKLEETQSANAVSALQGRIGGLKIINANGIPGGGVGIQLRGATTLTNNKGPLVMVDGVIITTSISDLNFEDVESYEVVQGAAASALYGSRAANGIIVIKTKRGANLKPGSFTTTIKTEYGFQKLPREYPLATHHPYKLSDNWEEYDDHTHYWHVLYNDDNYPVSGSRSFNNIDSSYADQPYYKVHNYQKEIFQKGQYYTLFASIGGKGEKSNYFVSYEHNKQQGIFQYTEGYSRNNLSFTLDSYFTEKLKLSVSSHLINTVSNSPGSIYNATFGMLAMTPDVNLVDSIKPDGSPQLLVYPDPWQSGVVENPLYGLYYINRNKNKNSFFGNINFKYDVFKFMKASIKYTYEYRYSNSRTIYPAGYEASHGSYINGTISSDLFNAFNQEIQPIINLNYKIDDLYLTSKLSYKYESSTWGGQSAYGKNFIVPGIYQLDNVADTNSRISSYNKKTVAINYFGIVEFLYKDTYMGSALIRKDASSLFGLEERTKYFFRLSGAVRLSNFIEASWLDEMKISSAYGGSGLRPSFEDQYETWVIRNSNLYPNKLGNTQLKPSISKEWEMSLNMQAINRISLSTTYSITNVSDALYRTPLPSQLGYASQVKNIGDIFSYTFSTNLDIAVVKKKNFNWNVGLVFDKTYQEIKKLIVPEFYQGPKKSFIVSSGEIYGTIYGYDWVQDLEVMEGQLPEGKTILDYELNDEGYVVPKGSIGSNEEQAIALDKENDGVPDKVVIGNGNSRFTMDLNNSFSLYGVNVSFLLSWKNGGDVYNFSRQYLYRDNRAIEIDQFGKAEDEKKSIYYYQKFYNNTEINSYFVEDGSYLKLRELSLSYNLDQSQLHYILGDKTYIKGIRIGIQGRNLYTLTGYKGFDPEVQYMIDGQYYPYDNLTYPNYQTYTFSLKVKI